MYMAAQQEARQRPAVWFSGTNVFVETAASIFRARKAMVLA